MDDTLRKQPRPITIRLPSDILKLLEMHAAQNGRTRSREIVTRLIASLALEDVYTTDSSQSRSQKKTRKEVSAERSERRRTDGK